MGAALALLPTRPLERRARHERHSLAKIVRTTGVERGVAAGLSRPARGSVRNPIPPRRQYVAFTRLSPVWVGRHVTKDAPLLGGKVLRLGGGGQPTGWLERLLFRQVGRVPHLDIGRTPLTCCTRGLPEAVRWHCRSFSGLPIASWSTLHGGDMSKTRNWHGTLQSRRWPAVVAAAARFVCVSAAVADMALAHGVPQTKIVVLPIGVEPPDRPPAPPAGPPRTACSWAASCPRRALRFWPTLFAAFAPRGSRSASYASAMDPCGRSWRRLRAIRAASN